MGIPAGCRGLPRSQASDLHGILYRSVKTTAVVLLLVASSRAMSQFLTAEQIPQQFSDILMAISENPIIILLTINVLLLAVGIFMDMTPAVLIFTPILAPVSASMGSTRSISGSS
jgi:TRAP-type C4-dicarboxylate transport system permease large subunit